MSITISQFKDGYVHFIGCGGAGMFPLALILIELGYKVSGSDMKRGANTDILLQRGAEINVGHNEENLPKEAKTLVVYSSAVPDDNPELSLAHAKGLTCLRRGEMLGCLSQLYKRTVAISGSHGKTTVTGMLAHIMESSGVQAGYMIGGKLAGKSIPARAGDCDIFITEVDESDGTHADMHCTLGLVTNVECDHSWSVGGEERLYKNFQTFAQQSDTLVYVQSEKSDQLFAGHANKEILVTSEIADKRSFAHLAPKRLAEWGEYQRANAALAINAAVKLGVDPVEAEKSMSSFEGVSRRMTTHYQTENTALIEDYAHHPTEVRVALSALRERFEGFKVTVIFQPHRYARLEKYLQEFADELRKADSVIVVPVFAAWVEKGEVDSCSLAELIGEKAVSLKGEWTEIANKALKTLSREENNVVAVFGAGTINEIISPLKRGLA